MLLKRALSQIKEDIKTIYDKDPAANNIVEVFLCYPGLHALILHRIAHKLRYWGIPVIPRLISYWSRIFTGIEIHPAAKIAPGVFIDHGEGVVIGETAEVGTGTVLYQGCTLGGTGKEVGKRHPTIGENCVISAGAKILGNITVGDYAKVGAGAVVLRNVPPHATVVGVPARIVRIGGSKDCVDLVQEKDDPMLRELCALRERVFALEERLNAQEKVNEDENLQHSDKD